MFNKFGDAFQLEISRIGQTAMLHGLFTFLRAAGGVEVRPEPVELGADRHARRRHHDAALQEDGPVERRGAGHREVDAAGEVGALVHVRVHQRQVQRHGCN